MGVKEILGYICLAGGVVLFVVMYLTPRLKLKRKNLGAKKDRLIRIEERTGLMIPFWLILIGAVLLT